ncbi:Predicted PurR-regulated permease PerM [Variovorax sp. HW608]|uniref:AI-2E family transporter n=1 Tax=Variovorax sp. HW608 TaxID=1034889 RepID=UPI00081F97BA|nr:AI-2E family transporter [Variovorax sp. HW608]SCK30472.1 Predicted PurR-regulated permease PerM [Variovorax sp. HW608]
MNRGWPRRFPRTWSIALIVLAMSAALGLLYLGRSILVPVTLAVLLCFAVNPLVRRLRVFGLGHVSSVLGAVASAALVIALLATLIGVHAIRMASHLPAYQATLERNLRSLRLVALSPIEKTWDAAEALFNPASKVGANAAEPTTRVVRSGVDGKSSEGVLQPKPDPMERLGRLLSWVAGPIGSAGITIVVLVFLLLERESLRDRFIRLMGGDLRATTLAINDAGDRLSRYLARQIAVNICFGLVIWVALAATGLPEAALIAAITAILRFVPYVGVLAAALLAMLLALGAAENWTLMLTTGAVFLTADLVTSHVIEPRVYGQATGLSPLSIVLATLFWGWLWGAVGVIIATPLTLCLAVAGRHAESLGFLDVVLGDGPALTMAQKFYQRALSGDSEEIIAGAREYLRRGSFARYCDSVLVPAIQLGRADYLKGQTTLRQQAQLRSTIVQVVEALDGAKRDRAMSPKPMSVLEEASSARLLRQRRMLREHPQTGEQPGDHSVVVCVGMGGPGDDLVTEILVRMLRSLRLDARDLTIEDLRSLKYSRMPETTIRVICLVTMTGGASPETGIRLARELRLETSDAHIAALVLPGQAEATGQAKAEFRESVDHIASSYEQLVLDLQAQAGSVSAVGISK